MVREAIGQEDALLEHLAKLLERPGVGVDVAMRVCLVLANTAVDSLENKERIGLETTPQVLQLLRAHPRNASVAKAALYLIHVRSYSCPPLPSSPPLEPGDPEHPRGGGGLD